MSDPSALPTSLSSGSSPPSRESPGCGAFIVLAVLLVVWPEFVVWLYSGWCFLLYLRGIWHFYAALEQLRYQRDREN